MNSEDYINIFHNIAFQTLEFIQNDKPNYIGNAKELFPIFYGCFDWHSSVHSHYQIIKLIQLYPNGLYVNQALELLDKHFTKENCKKEIISVSKINEVPYGMAWVLILCGELVKWNTELSIKWYNNLKDLENYAKDQIIKVCCKSTQCNYSGQHYQTAFSLTLAWDYCDIVNDYVFKDLIANTCKHFYLSKSKEISLNIHYEPKKNDFLSSSLSIADLMSRILSIDEYSKWIEDYINNGLLTINPIESAHTIHLKGLNMSRCWMFIGISKNIQDINIKNELLSKAVHHFNKGFTYIHSIDPMVTHWVPTFIIHAYYKCKEVSLI